MATLNVSLPESMKSFVEKQVELRGFSTISEYLRNLIREAEAKTTTDELPLAQNQKHYLDETMKLLSNIESPNSSNFSNRDHDRVLYKK